MKEIYFVTGNLGKVASANKYFNEYGIEAKIIDLNTIESDINDIYAIAKEKVERAYEVLQKPCIANDSGFYIESYPDEPNFPGAFVNRKLLIPLGIDGLMDKMKYVENRNCWFEDVVAYYDGETFMFFNSISKGLLSKTISETDKKEQWSPLWKVFIPEGYDKTLSEFTDEERKERDRSKTSGIKEFAKWYSNTKELRL